MASHWSFGHLQPKLWAKEGPGVKLAVWFPTSKSRESTSSQHPIWKCNMALERSRQGLQLWLDLVAIRLCSQELWAPKVPRVQLGQFRDSIQNFWLQRLPKKAGFPFFSYVSRKIVATPLWPSVGVKPNTSKVGDLESRLDSRMFKARQQGSKHLALRFSWRHWKGLEV
jgi:hypothetical protein